MFFVRPDAPPAVASALLKEEDEMGCGALARVFVRRMPSNHGILKTLRAIEFDSLGKTLREWPLPGDAGFFEIVRGVRGDEVVAAYPGATSAIFMRIKTDGSYIVSAEPPAPLGPEEWIEVADSTWRRVRPKDEGTFTVYAGSTREDAGTWVPRGGFRVVCADGLRCGSTVSSAGSDASGYAKSEVSGLSWVPGVRGDVVSWTSGSGARASDGVSDTVFVGGRPVF